MPGNGTTDGLGISWQALARDGERLAWWYSHRPPSQIAYPSELIDSMKDERARLRAHAACRPAYLGGGAMALLRRVSTRLHSLRPELTGSASGATEVSLVAKQS